MRSLPKCAIISMVAAKIYFFVSGDAFDHISCPTAVTLDGKVLWQIGRPDPGNRLLTMKDLQLRILEGATSKRTYAPVSNPTYDNSNCRATIPTLAWSNN